MNIPERIFDRLKQAMRDRDKPLTLALRNIRGELQKADKAKLEPLTNDEVIQNLSRQAKRCRDAVAEFQRAGRMDMVAKEEGELAIILDYLPKQAGREEIETIARQVIADLGAKSRSDMGKVMGPLMGQFRGEADGTLVSTIVGELLDELE